VTESDREAWELHIAAARTANPGIALAEDDMQLAWACARGDADALVRCMAMLRSDVERAAARARGTASTADDLAQRLWTRLFVAEHGATPWIARYTGASALRSWARVILVRLVIDEQRRRGARPEEPMRTSGFSARVMESHDDPELVMLRARHLDEIRAAVRRAVDELPVRERALLRHRLLEGLDTGAIGMMFGVHRTTAARWIDHAFAGLRERTRSILATELRLGERELTSLVGVVHRDLEVSVGGLLRSREPDSE
jgi:RNA polymerase sigma-70 factor (ECF subfamily)